MHVISLVWESKSTLTSTHKHPTSSSVATQSGTDTPLVSTPVGNHTGRVHSRYTTCGEILR